jgi:hypothetical protein
MSVPAPHKYPLLYTYCSTADSLDIDLVPNPNRTVIGFRTPLGVGKAQSMAANLVKARGRANAVASLSCPRVVHPSFF